jgi:hypothetical protein
MADPLAAATASNTPPGLDWGPILIVVAICVVGYMVSIWLHPQKRCRLCNGSGRHRGAIFTYSSRRCRSCNGARYKLRFGTKVYRVLFSPPVDR